MPGCIVLSIQVNLYLKNNIFIMNSRLIDLKVKSSSWSQSSPSATQLVTQLWLWIFTFIHIHSQLCYTNTEELTHTDKNGNRMNNCKLLTLGLGMVAIFSVFPVSLTYCIFYVALYLWNKYRTEVIWLTWTCLGSFIGFILTF